MLTDEADVCSQRMDGFAGAALKVEKIWSELSEDSRVASWQSGRCW